MIEFFVMTGVLLVMFGLVASTEQVLKHRHTAVKMDERMIEHRSRL